MNQQTKAGPRTYAGNRTLREVVCDAISIKGSVNGNREDPPFYVTVLGQRLGQWATAGSAAEFAEPMRRELERIIEQVTD